MGLLAVALGGIALVSAGYLYYWNERRIVFHILPYVFVIFSTACFSVEFQKVDIGFAFFVSALIACIHALAIWNITKR